VAAGAEAVDRPHPWHHEAVTPRGESRPAAIDLTAEDLREIESAASTIRVQGDGYPEHLGRMTGP